MDFKVIHLFSCPLHEEAHALILILQLGSSVTFAEAILKCLILQLYELVLLGKGGKMRSMIS